MAAKEDATEVEKNFKVSINCLTCAEVEKTTDAIKYCLECKSYLCEECIQDHNKFAALRRHQLVEITEAAVKAEETDQPKVVTGVECGLHYGQNIDSYCKDHDEVCCPICMTVKHRSCKQTQKIQEVAKGFKESKEFNGTKQALQKLHEYANIEKRDRNINLATLDEEKSKILADIDMFEQYLIHKIKDCTNASRENLRVAHAIHVCYVKSDVKELDTVMSGLKDSLNKLNKTDRNEIEAFVCTKSCQKTFAELKLVVKDLSDKWLQTDLYMNFNDNIIAKGTTAIGEVIEETKNNETYILTCKTYNIKACEVTAICPLSDETFVIMDRGNANLKRLTDTFDVTDCINLSTSPICMCVTGPQEVAVSICGNGPQRGKVSLKKRNLIQFVTADDKLTLGPSFSVAPGICSAITYDSTERTFFICCIKNTNYFEDDTILVYSREGTELKTYNTGIKICRLLTKPYQILIGKRTITVENPQEGLVVFDFKKTDEDFYRRTTKVNLGNQRCLCFISGDNMLVQNKNAEFDNMSLLSKDGQHIKTLKMENSMPILTAVFNKQKSTLLVAGKSCEIREYPLPFKLLKLLE